MRRPTDSRAFKFVDGPTQSSASVSCASSRCLGTEQPGSALLVVETAQTSQGRDREKARDHARANVPDYRIVDLAARTLDVYRRPLAGGYEEVTTFGDGQSVRPLVGDAPPVHVSALMG